MPQVKPVLLDLLMATLDSPKAWSAAAGDRPAGLAWRDAVTERMIDAGDYVPYEQLVEAAARELRLSREAPSRLREAWRQMEPWPDTVAVQRLRVPYAFVTNSSTDLAAIAVERSGLRPAFVLSAEEAGCYKPRPEIYRLACERIGSEPGETLFVAGAAYDARGAAAAGLRTVLVARRPVLDPMPPTVRVVMSLHEAFATL